MLSRIRDVVRRRLLAYALKKNGGGLPDLTQIKKVPDHASYPLRRDGVDPVPELATSREENGPVTKLANLIGLDIWLVTGYDEARAVLADSNRYSNDIRHLLPGRDQDSAEGVGGLGHRLRGLQRQERLFHAVVTGGCKRQGAEKCQSDVGGDAEPV